MDPLSYRLVLMGAELASTVPVVDDVNFPAQWLVRKVLFPAERFPPFLPLVEGTEEFAPPWTSTQHRTEDDEMSLDVSCYFGRDILVVGIGTLISDGRLLASPEFMPEYWRQALISNDYAGLRQDFALPRRVIDGKTIVVCGWGVDVYGHFLIEMLPRLWVARRTLGPAFDNYQILLRANSPQWLGNILTRELGIPASRFVTYDPGAESIVLTHAVLPTLTSMVSRFHPSQNACITDTIDQVKPHNALSVPRIYVARRGVANPFSSRRHCANQVQLARIAEDEFGFRVIQPETLNWSTQIELFRNARIVAGEFGSGMHNTVFSGADTRVGCIGITNLAQSHIGSLRRQRNAYLATPPLDGETYSVEETRFRGFLAALTAGSAG